MSRSAPGIDLVDSGLALCTGRRVVALERQVGDVVEVFHLQSTVGEGATAFDRNQPLQQIQMASFLQYTNHVMTHDARLRVRRHDSAAKLFDQEREIERRPGISRREVSGLAA